MKGSFSALNPKRQTLASPKPYTTIPMPETHFAALGLMGLMHAFQQPSLHEDLRWFYYILLATPCWPMCGVYTRSEQTFCNGQYAILATFPPAHPERTLVPHHPSLHLGPVNYEVLPDAQLRHRVPAAAAAGSATPCSKKDTGAAPPMEGATSSCKPGRGLCQHRAGAGACSSHYDFWRRLQVSWAGPPGVCARTRGHLPAILWSQRAAYFGTRARACSR